MKAVDVSVVVTNYNYGRYVRRCVRSILNQDFDRSRYEIVVVDDASTDDSLTALESYAQSGDIRLVTNKTNMGIGASSCVGLNHTRAKYFVRVDADDYVQPAFLYMLYHFLRFRPDRVGVSCDYFITNDDERVIETKSFENDPLACGLMMKTSYLESIGSYNPEKRIFEDKDLFARIDFSRVSHLQVPLYNYVKHGNSATDKVAMPARRA